MQKDNEIRTLRAKHKQKEMILKRKQEEVRYKNRRQFVTFF
jgi:hypothetical protein